MPHTQDYALPYLSATLRALHYTILCAVHFQMWTSRAVCQDLEQVCQVLSRLFALDLEPDGVQ